MSLRSLVADPRFKQLSPDEQKQAVLGVEPRASQLSDSEYNQFVGSLVSKPPPTLASRAADIVNQVVKPHLNLALPVENPVFNKLENAGNRVNASVQNIAGRVAEKGNPLTGTIMSLGGNIGALTPSNAILGIGGELASTAAPVAAKALSEGAASLPEGLARAIGNKLLNTPRDIITKARRLEQLTPGEQVIKRPLGFTRDAVSENSQNMIDKLEEIIQSKISKSSQAARNTAKPVNVVGTPKLVYQGGNLTPPKLSIPDVAIQPGGETIPLPAPNKTTSEPFMRNLPQSLNARGGKTFVEDASVAENQFAHEKQAQAEMADNLRRFKERQDSISKQGLGVQNPNTISSKDVANGLNDLSSEIGKTGTSDREVRQLNRLKDEFLSNHPKTADAEYWNDVKRALYNKIGNKEYIRDATKSTKILGEKQLASTIREKLSELIPGLNDLNKLQGVHLELRDLANLAGDAHAKNIFASLFGDTINRGMMAVGKTADATASGLRNVGNVLTYPLKTPKLK